MMYQLARDHTNHHTYIKDYLGAAFPIVNLNEVEANEKAENMARWKSRNGFDTMNKRENWNALPKKLTDN